jgi:hypothetical protein
MNARRDATVLHLLAGIRSAAKATTPGMVHSPYTGRLYDVGDIPSGGLVIDTEVEKLFRRPVVVARKHAICVRDMMEPWAHPRGLGA